MGDIARKRGIPFYLNADDTQLYLSFTSNCPNNASNAKETVELCVKVIGDWMLCNRLKLNQDKTELLVVGSRYRTRPPLNHIQIGDDVISPCEHARNLGVGIDHYFDFSEQVYMTCKMAFFRFCGIAKIRRYLSHDTSNTTGAPNEYFSENEPLTTENENLDAFKAFSSAFLCCWKEFICSSLPAG